MSLAQDEHVGASPVSAPIAIESEKIGSGMQIGISSFGAWMLGVGANVGSFAFLIHASMIGQAGPLASVFAWCIAALMALPLAIVLAELSSIFPSAGGPYVYKYFALKRLVPKMGELLGFLTGWIFWIYLITCYSCMSNGLVNLLSSTMWGKPQTGPIWFGPVIITLLFGSATLLNLLQVKSASRLNNLFTVLKLAVAAGFIILVLTSPHAKLSNLLQIASPGGSKNLWLNIMCVLPLAMAGFSGTEMSGCVGSETANAGKNLPRAILLTFFTFGFVYIGMCAAVGLSSPFILSPDKTVAMIQGTSVQATAPSLAGFLGGPALGAIVTGGVLMSIVSCAFSGMLATARTSFSMAQTGLFPKQFAKLHPVTKVPQYALIFQFFFMTSIGIGANVLARTGVLPDSYAFLGATCGFLYGLLAMLYGVCLIGLRYTDPQIARPFRIGKQGNLLAWIMAIGSAAVYALVTFQCTTVAQQIAGIGFLLAGIPVYAYYRWRPQRD
ncbi:MAG TPA: APC family permease [Trichormus sp.]|jgi:amino acid transporter